jgi:hypothetical protein
MVDQTIPKPPSFIRGLKIFVHGILYIVTFIINFLMVPPKDGFALYGF